MLDAPFVHHHLLERRTTLYDEFSAVQLAHVGAKLRAQSTNASLNHQIKAGNVTAYNVKLLDGCTVALQWFRRRSLDVSNDKSPVGQARPVRTLGAASKIPLKAQN